VPSLGEPPSLGAPRTLMLTNTPVTQEVPVDVTNTQEFNDWLYNSEDNPQDAQPDNINDFDNNTQVIQQIPDEDDPEEEDYDGALYLSEGAPHFIYAVTDLHYRSIPFAQADETTCCHMVRNNCSRYFPLTDYNNATIYLAIERIIAEIEYNNVGYDSVG